MKSSLALVECLLFLGAFSTRCVSLFSGVVVESGSGVDSPPSDCLFSTGVSKFVPERLSKRALALC